MFQLILMNYNYTQMRACLKNIACMYDANFLLCVCMCVCVCVCVYVCVCVF